MVVSVCTLSLCCLAVTEAGEKDASKAGKARNVTEGIITSINKNEVVIQTKEGVKQMFLLSKKVKYRGPDGQASALPPNTGDRTKLIWEPQKKDDGMVQLMVIIVEPPSLLPTTTQAPTMHIDVDKPRVPGL